MDDRETQNERRFSQTGEKSDETPVDQRLEYDRATNQRQNEDLPRGPAPYDVASAGTPQDKTITKGERERPGPTTPVDAGAMDIADNGGGHQQSRIDRRESSTTNAEQDPDEPGDLGGGGLHDAIEGRSPRDAAEAGNQKEK